ncbi:MAG: AzlD domain-containing protein [Betaproteobacteria bacterium]|nr:MAG: AzlD domain-containing protein [Betaproteobacteria bacterium]
MRCRCGCRWSAAVCWESPLESWATRWRPSVDRELTIWLLIFAVGALTYTARLSFIALFAHREMPPLMAQALKHVPVAMVTAIVVPAVVFTMPGELRLDVGNAKLIAALVAGAVAAWRQSAVMTIAVGMIVLWSLRYVVG